MRKSWTITWWVSTILLSLFIVPGAVFDIIQVQPALDLMVLLGYPAYVLLLVGWGKLLGIIGIWQNKVHFLREWAYAGLLIDLGGALASHLFVGDTSPVIYGIMVGIALTVVSYVSLRKTMKK